MKLYERHPLSAAMGDFSPDELIAMQQDIAAHGVREPIVIFEDMVLDGWNRFSTATGLKLPCPQVAFSGTYIDAEAFVWSKHFARRNWDASQRALAQANITKLRGGRAEGGAAPGAGVGLVTIAQEAANAGVSVRTQRQARVVADKGSEALQRAVMDGDLSVKKAADIASKPKREQKAALDAAKNPAPKRAAPRETAAAASWRPAGAPPAAPLPRIGVTAEAHAELEEKNAALIEEVERLTDALAVAKMDGTDEEKQEAATTIADLRAENATLRATLSAVQAVRDNYMRESAEMLSQLRLYRNQLQKFKAV